MFFDEKTKNLVHLGSAEPYCPNCTKISYTDIQGGRYAKKEDMVYMILKKGKYGNFAGCPNFPKCKYSYSLTKKNYNIDYEDELRPY
jgi:hypothetical protein